MALQRPQRVKVRAQSVKGETLMLTLTDWQARIFQHEYDHLQVCAAPASPFQNLSPHTEPSGHIFVYTPAKYCM